MIAAKFLSFIHEFLFLLSSLIVLEGKVCFWFCRYRTVIIANFLHFFNFIAFYLSEIFFILHTLLNIKLGRGLVVGIQTIKTQWFRPLVPFFFKTMVSEVTKAPANFGHQIYFYSNVRSLMGILEKKF